jgi:hypothetical protein
MTIALKSAGVSVRRKIKVIRASGFRVLRMAFDAGQLRSESSDKLRTVVMSNVAEVAFRLEARRVESIRVNRTL